MKLRENTTPIVASLIFLISFIIFLRDFSNSSKALSAKHLTIAQAAVSNFKYAATELRAAVYYPKNRTSGFSMQELLDLCHNGESLQITKEWAIRGTAESLTENYLGSCYALEISQSQSRRSMGHCSDIIQYVYYGNARLSVSFGQSAYESKGKLCPQTTYLHGEFFQESLLKHPRKLRNLWLPNLEQIEASHLPLYQLATKILCKTKITCTASQMYMDDVNIKGGATLKYMSHSSPDARENAAELLGVDEYKRISERDDRYNRFYHAYGHSGRKSTDDLLHCWYGHPKWPKLTVVGHHNPHEFIRKKYRGIKNLPRNIEILSSVPVKKLRELQLSNGIHLCPSQQEGYGHYINEARAFGALVMTTHYPPMEEFVEDGVSGVLIEHERPWPEPHQALQKYFISPVRVSSDDICRAVEKVMALDLETRKEIGRHARLAYEKDTEILKENMKELVKEAEDFLRNGE
ncbi:UNVERIFIED_CONTAM: hypothetical protein HDU68_005720 [Siphonaria sp. JEL0065]|nr:hypothetical protein HDU68_005720 [Siphonaria sp. JEL0065]